MAPLRELCSLLLVTGFSIFLFLPSVCGSNVCTKQNGSFPKPGSFCKSYYLCQNWRSKEMVCPEGKHFSPSRGLCVSPEEYPCLETLHPASLSTQDDEAKVRKSRSLMLEFNWPKMKKGLKRFPHVMSCHHFYATKLDGSHVIKKCPEGEIFDYPTLKCSRKASAKCWSDQFKPRNSKKIAKKNFICPFVWGLYPDIEDCSQFFNCLNGRPYHRTCPPSLSFDKAERKCVTRKEAICADQSDVVESGYKCPYTWGFFTYAKDCSKYYECLQKNPSLRSCKRDMLFDNQKRKCLPKDSVECGARFNPYAISSAQITTKDSLLISKSYSDESLLLSDSSSSEESSEEVGKKKSTTTSKNRFSTLSSKLPTSDSSSSEKDKTSSKNKELTTNSRNKYTKIFTKSVTMTNSDSSEEYRSTGSKKLTTKSNIKSTKVFPIVTSDLDSSEEDESTESKELTTNSIMNSTKLYTNSDSSEESTESKELTTRSNIKSSKLYTDTVTTDTSNGPTYDTKSTGNEYLTTISESKSSKLFTDIVMTTNSDKPEKDTGLTANELLTTASKDKPLVTNIVVTSNSDNPAENTESTKLFTNSVTVVLENTEFTEKVLLTTESENKSKLLTETTIADSENPVDSTEPTRKELVTTELGNKSTKLFIASALVVDSETPGDSIQSTGN